MASACSTPTSTSPRHPGWGTCALRRGEGVEYCLTTAMNIVSCILSCKGWQGGKIHLKKTAKPLNFFALNSEKKFVNKLSILFQGDSGGPLFYCSWPLIGPKECFQVGITSFGKGCGDKKYPGTHQKLRWTLK